MEKIDLCQISFPSIYETSKDSINNLPITNYLITIPFSGAYLGFEIAGANKKISPVLQK